MKGIHGILVLLLACLVMVTPFGHGAQAAPVPTSGGGTPPPIFGIDTGDDTGKGDPGDLGDGLGCTDSQESAPSDGDEIDEELDEVESFVMARYFMMQAPN